MAKVSEKTQIGGGGLADDDFLYVVDTSESDGKKVRVDGLRDAMNVGNLKVANNLNDVADPATARTNLSVYSTTEVDDAIAAGAGGGALDDLSDVDTSSTPPTDGQALVFDEASATWVPGAASGGGGQSNYDVGEPTVPLVASMTWFNQGASTAVDGAKSICLTPERNAVNYGLVVTSPTAPFTYNMRMQLQTTGSASTGVLCLAGLVLRNSSTGKYVLLCTRRNFGSSTAGKELVLQRFTGTTYNSGVILGSSLDDLRWMHVSVTSTTADFMMSRTGEHPVTLHTETIASHLGSVDQVGFAAYMQNAAGYTMSAIIDYFSETAPA